MYFFIDPDKLTTQTLGDSYGPDNGNSTTLYNVTSQFQLTEETKAFACEDCYMIVRQSSLDSSLVNVILKPVKGLNNLVDIDYYIYRGLLKSDFLSGSNITPKNDSTNTKFINRFWTDWEAFKVETNQPNLADLTPVAFGFDNSLSGSLNVEKIFDDSQVDTRPIYVKEGEWFGNFTSAHKISFEIVQNTNRLIVDLNHVQAIEHQINVSGLGGGFTERVKREQVLYFIDPAAFYGMYFNEGVSYYNEGSTNNTLKTTTTLGDRFIYTKLLDKFHTKNRVYIDIRSEKGYSYNFYQNYGDTTSGNNIQVAVQNLAVELRKYETNSWPIIFLDDEQTTTGNRNKVRLSLIYNDNTSPILYVTFKPLRKTTDDDGTNYIRLNKQSGVAIWTKEFEFKYPNVSGSSGKRNNIAGYVKMYYFWKAPTDLSTPTTILKNERYFDSAFCSVDIPLLGDQNYLIKHVESENPIYVKEPLNDTTGIGNFELNMINGAYWDNQRVLFYAKIEFENSKQVSGKEYLSTYSQKLDLNLNNEYTNSQVYKRTEIICRQFTDIIGNFKIPGVNFHKSIGVQNADVSKNHKENLMLLGLSIDELNAIKGDTQLLKEHQRFIHLEPNANNPLTDSSTNPKRYYEYTVKLQGMFANGVPQIVTPQLNGSPILVYSRDNQFFSSKDFAVNEVVTNTEDRIEFHVSSNGCVKINDNIDFALALLHGESRVNYRYFRSFVERDQNGVVLQGINDAENGLVDGFELVMANKMVRLNYRNRTPTQKRIIDFPENTFDDTEFNIPLTNYEDEGISGVDAGQSHMNANGDIVTFARVNNRPRNGYRKYKNLKKKVFLIKLVSNLERDTQNHITSITLTNNDLGIDLTFVKTLRLYANPTLAAAIIGALVEINHDIICQGFAFKDATCYPSAEHVNGEALDTNYTEDLAQDSAFIAALNRFGFGNHLVGNNRPHLINLHNFSTTDNTHDNIQPALHNGHLHSSKVKLINENCN